MEPTLAGISADNPSVASTLQRLVQHATATAPRVFGANVFAYWLLSVEPHATVWFHLVYGQVVFLAFTMPRADISPDRAAA
jgi:hypothetical protein